VYEIDLEVLSKNSNAKKKSAGNRVCDCHTCLWQVRNDKKETPRYSGRGWAIEYVMSQTAVVLFSMTGNERLL
jgi:hypothetical protein